MVNYEASHSTALNKITRNPKLKPPLSLRAHDKGDLGGKPSTRSDRRDVFDIDGHVRMLRFVVHVHSHKETLEIPHECPGKTCLVLELVQLTVLVMRRQPQLEGPA